MIKRKSYLEIATMAARLEMDGEYARAADLWGTAGELAKKDKNEAWCQARAEVCEKKGPLNQALSELPCP